ncbi:TPA: hypothetical protein ACJ511_000117 [Streptococcus suis]
MAELGQAYVQIMPSAQGISGSIRKIIDPEAKSAGESAGQAIGGNLVSTITKVIAAAGIGKLIKDGLSASLSAGADIQQSFGGLDTLYKGAQKEIKQYAADAYKAGISANSYAEQATSFGATLKQSLGGDAVAAAKAANMAIMDMADNSAKMGTDIETVQQTYQSLARGNYAMLDNLKLGYGGTKAEMERLLQTASKLTGKNFDISNFADVTEAIHAVQQDLGIAGVAVDEASTTFSGSLQAMKSSFTNVLGALSSGEMDITPQLNGLAETTANFLFGNFIPMVGNIIKTLPSALGTFLSAAKAQILPRLQSLLDAKGIKIDLSKLSLGGMGEVVAKVMAGLGVAFAGKNLLKGFKLTNPFAGLANMAKSAGTAVKSAFSGLGKGIASVFKGIGAGISKVFQGIARAISMLNPAGVASFAIGLAAVTAALLALSAMQGMVLPFLQGLADIFVKLVGGVLQAFVSAIISLAPHIGTIAAGFAQLSPLVVAFGTAFSMVATSVGGAIAGIVTAIAGGVAQIMTALTPIVQIISTTFIQVVTVISQSIVQIIQALAPFIPSITSMFTSIASIVSSVIVQIVQALAPFIPSLTQLVTAVVSQLPNIINAFTHLASVIPPIIDSLSGALETFNGTLETVFSGAQGIIESFGSAVSGILDSVAGVFNSIGNAALNAGTGFQRLASGISKVTSLNIFDMGASLAAVAVGLTAIVASGIGSAGPGLHAAGMGMQMMATSAQMASVAIQMLPTALTTLSASLGTLPAMMTMAGTAMMTFATSAQSSVMSLMAIGATITQFATMMVTIGPAATVASAGLATFNGQANAAGSAMSILGSASISALGQVTALGAGIVSSMIGATAAISSAGMQMATAVRMAGTQMTVAMQASMNQIKMVILNGMTASASAVRNGGTQMTTAIRSAGTQMVTITQSTMNQMKSAVLNGMTAIVSAVRNGGSQMVTAWQSAGQQMVSSTQNTVNNMNSSLRNVGSGVNLYSNGSALMAGLKSGIDAGWSSITASVSSMAEWIKKNKGPISYDKRLLIPNGLAIMYGLDKGITSGFEEVKSNVLSMANQLAEAISTSISDPFEMVGADAELTKRVAFGQLPKTVQPSVESFDSQKTLIEKVDALTEEVRRSGNTYLDGKIISRKVDRDLGQNTMIRSRTSWA